MTEVETLVALHECERITRLVTKGRHFGMLRVVSIQSTVT